MVTIKDLFRIWIVSFLVFLGITTGILVHHDYTKYRNNDIFSCTDGFWQVTIDQKTQPIFIQPDGVIIPLVCNQPKE